MQRRSLWITVCVAVVLLVVILGAVLGTQLHKGSGSAPALPGPAIPDPVPVSTIRPNSGLGVTGWRSGTDFNIRLLYQSNDGYMRLVGSNSKFGNWTVPLALAKAELGTPLTLCSFHVASYLSQFPDIDVEDPKVRVAAP